LALYKSTREALLTLLLTLLLLLLLLLLILRLRACSSLCAHLTQLLASNVLNAAHTLHLLVLRIELLLLLRYLAHRHLAHRHLTTVELALLWHLRTHLLWEASRLHALHAIRIHLHSVRGRLWSESLRLLLAEQRSWWYTKVWCASADIRIAGIAWKVIGAQLIVHSNRRCVTTSLRACEIVIEVLRCFGDLLEVSDAQAHPVSFRNTVVCQRDGTHECVFNLSAIPDCSATAISLFNIPKVLHCVFYDLIFFNV